MCKDCGQDPYLAGRLVVVEMPVATVLVDEVVEGGWTKQRRVETEDRRRSYIARCVGHHRGNVTVRTRYGDMTMREDKILAYCVD